MKLSRAVFALAAAAAFNPATAAEVVVREVPLTWQQAAITDGGELYQELCAVCHGAGGKGDGPAASGLKKTVPDLTGLAARNGGEFPHQAVEEFISGEKRVVEHGTVDMPIWGRAFEGVRPDWSRSKRKALAEQRIYNITEYLVTIQQP